MFKVVEIKRVERGGRFYPFIVMEDRQGNEVEVMLCPSSFEQINVGVQEVRKLNSKS